MRERACVAPSREACDNDRGFPGALAQVRADLLDPNEANFTYGHIDPRVVERIQPCLKVLSNSVDLLEASDGVVRFRYYGWIRDKEGFEAWAKMLMEDNGCVDGGTWRSCPF